MSKMVLAALSFTKEAIGKNPKNISFFSSGLKLFTNSLYNLLLPNVLASISKLASTCPVDSRSDQLGIWTNFFGPGNKMMPKLFEKVETGETEVDEQVKIEDNTESNENVNIVPFCATVSTKMFLIYFSIITILTLIMVKVFYFPSRSVFDVFADADTDIESDSEIGPDSPIERLFVPINRGNSFEIHTFNTDGSGYKFLDFGLYKTFDHVHALKTEKDILLVSYKRASNQSLSYLYNWEKNTITKPLIEPNSYQMVANHNYSLLAFICIDQNGISSIEVCDENLNSLKRCKSNKFNYSLPRFGGPANNLFYVENDIDSNDMFVIKSVNLDDMKTSAIFELTNRPEDMYVSSHLEILVKIRNNDGQNELIAIDSKNGKSKSILKTKKEINCLGWSSDGSVGYFSKQTGISGRHIYKAIAKADGKTSFRSIKYENGDKIRI